MILYSFVFGVVGVAMLVMTGIICTSLSERMMRKRYEASLSDSAVSDT
jgi:hypothetical protein